MILRCRVVTVTRNRKGQPIRAAKVVAGDPISLGRGAEATIYLPDLRVNLGHAVIRNDDLGKLHVEAQDAQIEVNGELKGRTKLRQGDRILIGPYQISPEPAAGSDHDFTLAIELVQPFPDEMVDLKRRSKILLSSTWLPKRALAWAGFAAIACFGLAFPLAYATSPAFKQSSTQEFPQPLRNVVWDVAWDPGPLSLGHQSLSRRCDVCHQVPFERVQDKACVKCHVVTGDHVSAVSAKAGVSLVTRCAECHRDHKGENAIVRTDAQLCVGCHGDIGALYPKTSLAAVSDFADAHPRFALTMVNASTGEVEAVPPDAVVSLHENSGLKFPHATHLAPAGIRSPQGLRVLECAQCHRPDEAGVRFQSVKMKDTCSECHRLEFEPALTTRQAPHGDPAAVLTSLREFYSSIALGERPIDVTLVNDLLRRPVASRSEVTQRNAFAWAEGKAQTVAADLIEKRVCMQCHDVRRASASSTPAGSEWVIAPVKITARWMPGAVFDHRTHRISTCQTCHDVKSSKTSADIAMPTLAVCRSCHVGAVAVRGKVRSPCEMCHSFHQHQKPLDQRAAAFMGATSQPQGAGEPR